MTTAVEFALTAEASFDPAPPKSDRDAIRGLDAVLIILDVKTLGRQAEGTSRGVRCASDSLWPCTADLL